MRPRTGVTALAPSLLVALLALAALAPRRPASAQPPSPPGGVPTSAPAAPDSFAAERDSLEKVVMESIKGRENMRADSVFKNLKVMKAAPAPAVWSRS
ncbi:MAG: hypothetical protein ACREOU_13365 [Candidatus Eiseniibacteriota bacterium]